MEDIVGFVVENEIELKNTIVPDSFFVEGKNIDSIKFGDYALFSKQYTSNFEEGEIVDESDYILIIWIGRKVGLCYDSNITNKQSWMDYFNNNETIKVTKDGY